MGTSCRFIADSMLGTLARRLRMLGIDTPYLRDADDSELIYLVRSQCGVLLTRDTGLARELNDRAWFVTGRDVREEFLSIAPAIAAAGCHTAPMTRCLSCNDLLTPVKGEPARAKVPPHILEKGVPLVSCPSCGKIYWKGTHAGRMKREIEWMEQQLKNASEVSSGV